MINLLGLQARVTEGYSRADLVLVLGVSRPTVNQWIDHGWLRPKPTTDRIPEEQVLRFIKSHPEEYSLKGVDEAWFKGMLFPSFGTNAHDPRDRAENPVEEVA
jgi:hypothetical protein